MQDQARHFLFLQGPHGPFFARLAGQLTAKGHLVTRIDLNAADRIFWPWRFTYQAFKHPQDAWRSYLDAYIQTHSGGFEALLRGVPVHCYGLPFYAGWGLTHDTLKAPHWRRRHVELWQLAHATLIDYPRYFDPIYKTATSPERVIALLANGLEARQSALLRFLAKLQGWALSPPFDRIYRRRK